MSEASSGRPATNPPPPRQRMRAIQGPSQASPLADGPFAGRSDTSSCDSTQNTPFATETNTEPIRGSPLDRRTRSLPLVPCRENTGASSSTDATGQVCMPLPLALVSASMGSESQRLRSGNRGDIARETPILPTAADPVRPVSPPLMSYLASQRLGAGSPAHRVDTRPSVSFRPATAPTVEELEDLLQSDPLEGPWNDPEMADKYVRPALSEGADACNLPSSPQEFRPEALEALDLIFNVNPDLPLGVHRVGFFAAPASTVPPPPALTFYPLRSPNRFSAAREMGAITPLPINPAIDTPPPAALPIDPQVTLGPSRASEPSNEQRQEPPPPGQHENLAVVEQNFYYSSRSPVPRFRTMSHNPWVVGAGEISTISEAPMAGGRSTVVDRDFGSPSLYGTEYMGTGGIERGFFSISTITRPGFSDETLLSSSGTDRMQELASSAYPTLGLPVPNRTSSRYSSAGEPYLDSAVGTRRQKLSRASAAPLGHHSYTIDPLRIGEPLIFNTPAPPIINPRATYSSYPPLPLPPLEQTHRPWTMDVSENGTQFLSLRDCDLSVRPQGDEGQASSVVWTGSPGGRLNAVGERVLRIWGSESRTGIVTGTPPVSVQEEDIESSDSSDQQPATKKQRTSEHRPRQHHTLAQVSVDDLPIAGGGLSTGGKSIPGWVPKAVTTEGASGDAGTREEEPMTPTKRDWETQRSREAVSQIAVRTSTTPPGGQTVFGRFGVTPTGASTPCKREVEDKAGNYAILTSGEQAVTPVPKRLIPVVEIIVPAAPRAVPKALPTGMEPVPEKRRSRGRPRKVVVSDEAVASEGNTITDAGLYTGPVVALGWLVPYCRGEPICLPGCKSLPETVGCLRCFDKRFPGRREREGLMSPEMVFRRLRPGISSAAPSPREAPEAQGSPGLPARSKTVAAKRLPPSGRGQELLGVLEGEATPRPAGRGSKELAKERSPALEKVSGTEVLSNLSDPHSKGQTPTPPLSGLSERSVKKRPLTPGEVPGVRTAGRWSVPPSWEPPFTRASAEVSPPPTVEAVSTPTSARRPTLSTIPTKNVAPPSRKRRSTISTLEPQALEKQTSGPASCRKARGSTPARRKLPARDSRGKFILLASKTADTSGSTAEAETTPKRAISSRSKTLPAKEKAVATSQGGKGDSRNRPFPNSHSRHLPGCEDESGSEDESEPDDGSEAEDGSQYKA